MVLTRGGMLQGRAQFLPSPQAGQGEGRGPVMAETSHALPSLAMDERGAGRASQRLGGGGVEPAPLDVSVIDAVEATPLKPSVLAVDRGRHAGGAGDEAFAAVRPLFPAGAGGGGMPQEAGRSGVEGSERLSGLERRLALVSAGVGVCLCALVRIGVSEADAYHSYNASLLLCLPRL